MIYQPRNVQPSANSIDANVDNTFSMEVQTNGSISSYRLYITDFNNQNVYTSSQIVLNPKLYNGDTLYIPVEKTVAGLTNGLNYKWHVRLYQDHYDMLITYGNVLSTGTSSAIYIQKRNINIRAGMYLTINGEQKYITDYNYDTGVIQLDESFSFIPSVGTQYFIYSNFIDTNPDYIFYAREEPTVSISNVPDVLTLKYFSFEGYYQQENNVPITYHIFNLYILNSDGTKSLIDTSGKVYSANLNYYYDSFRTGNYYYIEMIVENDMGIMSSTELYSFSVSYEIIEYLQQPTATFNSEQNAIDVSWAAPVEHEGKSVINSKATDSGKGIYIENASNSIIEELRSEGVSIQKTTTGKNILPFKNIERTINGVTFTPVYDTNGYLLYVNVNGTATENAIYPLNTNSTSYQKDVPLDADTSYYFNGRAAGTEGIIVQGAITKDGSSLWPTGAFTTGNTIEDFGAYIRINSGYTVSNYKVYPSLELGSSFTSYEPFTGNKSSPSPDYVQNITPITGSIDLNVIGKNLFDKDTTNVLGAYFENSEDTIKSSSVNKILYFKCDTNTTYTFTKSISSLSNKLFGVATTNNIPAIGETVYNYVDHRNDTEFTYTTNSTAKYVVIRIRIGDYIDEFLSAIQIERGSIATEYEPYKSQTISIDLGDNKYCSLPSGEKDEIIIRDGHAKLIKKIRNLQLAIEDMDGENDYPGWTNQTQLKLDYPNENDTFDALGIEIISNISNDPTSLAINTNGQGTLFLPINFWGSSWTQTYWKTNYPDLVLDLYYSLASSEEIDLGEIQLPSTFNGVNNIVTIPETFIELKYSINISDSSGLFLYNTPYNGVNSLYTTGYTTNWYSEGGICEMPTSKNITMQFNIDDNFFYNSEGRYTEYAPIIIGEAENTDENFQIIINKNKLIFSTQSQTLESYFYENTNETFVLSASKTKQINNDYIWQDVPDWDDTYYWVEGGTSLERIVNHWWKVQITDTSIKIEEIF